MTDKSITLSSPLTLLSGIGPAVKEKLNKRNIYKVGDFLFLLPCKYQDRTSIIPVSDLVYGNFAQILVKVKSASIQYKRQRMLVIECYDDSGLITIRLFNFSKFQISLFKPNVRILIYGQAVKSNGRLAMMHPETKVLKYNEIVQLSDKLTPIYPSTLGIGSVKISKWISISLGCLDKEELQDFSDDFLQKYRLAYLKDALKYIHQPSLGQCEYDILNPDNPNFRRIVLDELLAKQIGMLRKKINVKEAYAFPLKINNNLHNSLLQQLSFTLTSAQQRVITDIFTDLKKSSPMHRLVQGDVGSGKTLVAFSAVLQAAANNLQAVIMSPTETLSEQHYAQAKKILTKINLKCVCLLSKTKAKERREFLAQIADGSAQVIIGTHALFQDKVIYHRLGFIVIDEQHRFGVHQRLLLKEKAQNTGKMPHMLVMTATPIPRTLAMSYYADLDTSVIDELPPNRKKIDTVLLADDRRPELIERIKNLIAKGQQVYWVCPLIDESDVLQAQAAENIYQQLAEILPEINLGLLHGRQKSDEKSCVISKFQRNKIQLLVSTTVIEVGVDVPNATLMVIENAERFGLAQLHQLRGRVGRGTKKSFCVLLFQQPLSRIAKQRLQIIRHFQDGFVIAQKDLEIRGAGEVLGTKQTGDINFCIADLERDSKLVETAFTIAKQLIINQPNMADELVYRWIGNAKDYSVV